ncbi:transcription-repair coupling factor [Bacteroidia bacterium]|nr:transcription-repair coupling factor [Bacteroidia bacterium]
MNSQEFVHLFEKHSVLKELEDEIIAGKTRFGIQNCIGSSKSIVLTQLLKATNRSQLILCDDIEHAENMYSDIEVFTDHNYVFLWKDSFRKSFNLSNSDNAKIQNNASVLDAISDIDHPKIVVTYPEAITEKIIDEDRLKKSKLTFRIGEEVDLDFLIELLNEYHFYREDFVYEPGQFSIRGGIIDLFSYANDLPIRLELLGRTIESIREFDPISQLSTKTLVRGTVVPNVSESVQMQGGTHIFKYLGDKPIVFCTDLPKAIAKIEKGLEKVNSQKTEEHNPTQIFFELPEIVNQITAHSVIEFGSQYHFRPSVKVKFNQAPQAPINKNFNLLIDTFKSLETQGYKPLIFSESPKQIERLESIFDDLNAGYQLQPVYKSLSEGFIDHSLKIAAYTEHQIFNRYYLARSGKSVSTSGAISLKELQNLNPGDFVVHIDHGIGQFKGLQRMEMAGKMQDAIRIEYKNNDLLYVNIASLYKISKYKGNSGNPPKVNKLGGDAWTNLKRKTKAQVKDIAKDLIKLYAKRKAEIGFKFHTDTYLQTELEASFLYEDTPDQAKATEDFKKDMESPYPMDRLICGDVGFGKTEIAIRAAFKAVTDSKQVAILVPTTILAQQHFQTFRDRLRDFPCNVDYINRFRTAKQQTQTLKNLEDGKLDIIIGTHKLLSKKTNFKDLGLLIIDEEQKFGVSAKERLKEFRANVDTLTLTATPIPRTLHFSLMGARDLSIIQTPPPNRRPVQTEVQVWNDEILKEAISAEITRGGQAFVIHNRVKDIQEIAQRVRNLVPQANVIVGHGQMKGDELEKVMVQFIEGEYNVLVATTIIESGLDIPNANTIVINNAHMFGLSDLHQMRGRVGRSNIKAYCHLLAPPIHTLPDEGRRRLQAIEEFSDLGSGFNVAMRDLDIRGAGNLLGAEQSGFIAEIGFNMYHKILDEAIQELRDGEFKEVLEKVDGKQKPKKQVITSTVETDFDARIPEKYVSNVSERINLYTQLSALNKTEDLDQSMEKIIDRFGKLPKEVSNLFLSIRLKIAAQNIYAEKLKTRGSDLYLYFNNDLGEEFYQDKAFSNIMDVVRLKPEHFSFNQANKHLILTIKGFGSIQDGLNEILNLAQSPELFKSSS